MRQLAKRTLQFFLPSFLASSAPNQERQNNIAVLDGLRGVACLIVFNEHLTYNISFTWVYGFGSGQKYQLNSLPFLRALWTGWSMVDIFFVISGYVLSYKPIKQWDVEQDPRTAYGTMAVSILKRGPRLYVPTFAALYIIAFSSYFGVFDAARANYQFESNKRWTLHEDEPFKLETFWAQLVSATRHCIAMFKLWNWRLNIDSGQYDLHTWTIPVEFRTSILMFILLAITLNMSLNRRVVVFCVLMLLAAFSELFDVACFFAGALLAMLEVQRRMLISLPLSREKAKIPTAVSWRMGMLWFTVGLFLISVPIEDIIVDPFYHSMAALFPKQTRDKGAWVRAIGSVITTWAVMHWPPAQALFTNRYTAYLGKISFAFYLVHGAIIRAVFHVVLPKYYKWSGNSDPATRTVQAKVIAWFVGIATCLPPSIWVSDVFWRAIDIPTVRFCRWLEKKAFEWQPKIRGPVDYVAQNL